MSSLSNLILLLAVALAGWWWLRPRYVFIVHINAGKPHCRRGKVTEAFLRDVEDVCRSSGVTEGSIYGTFVTFSSTRGDRVKQKMRIKLSFSSGFPPGCQQQLRNLSLIQQ